MPNRRVGSGCCLKLASSHEAIISHCPPDRNFFYSLCHALPDAIASIFSWNYFFYFIFYFICHACFRCDRFQSRIVGWAVASGEMGRWGDGVMGRMVGWAVASNGIGKQR
ncbi:MAG: hypothetical protein F6J90_25880 [Moorea sp. SIOASIH]|uniref:hypothetical protein n=1 Tax=Moorena sp. SIOASIH TaxID=2607817 RepID=UPI0013BE3920|nr:hypothetical protein [Moorena sp. SIOASIH]NEO39576.1 hypothetical protein [Moorena sp. SIOASIH]